MNNYLDSYYVVTGLSEETGARVYLAVDVLSGGLPYWTTEPRRFCRFDTLKEISDYSAIDADLLQGINEIHTMAIVVSSQLLNPIEFKEHQ